MTDINLTIIDRDGRLLQVRASAGASLMEALRDEVDATIGTCGGQVSCGTCRVLVEPEWAARLTQPSEDEVELLEALGADGHSRLSCQLVLDDKANGLRATIAPAD